MQLHKLTCSYISLHRVTWAYMQFSEFSWSSMSLHAVSWACMQFHELACSSFLHQSSSQEFCSACYTSTDIDFWMYIGICIFAIYIHFQISQKSFIVQAQKTYIQGYDWHKGCFIIISVYWFSMKSTKYTEKVIPCTFNKQLITLNLYAKLLQFFF